MTASSKTLLYVGGLNSGSTADRRTHLFEAAGWSVIRIDTGKIYDRHSLFSAKLANHLGAGPVVEEVQSAIASVTPNLPAGSVAFFDKPINVRPRTIQSLRQRAVTTVSYMPDDPFGPRGDGIWRLFRACLPLFDLHIVPRQVSVDDFKTAGAREVEKISFSFDPRTQFPPAEPTNLAGKKFRYIGAAYEQRPRFLMDLHQRLADAGVGLAVTGSDWSRPRTRHYARYFQAGPNVWEADYREAIWDSMGCLGFVTRLNRDELSHKAIEIAACGRAPIIEPVSYHAKLFQDGESAIFFENLDQCAEKLIHYAARPEALAAIGAAAARRVRAVDHSEERVIQLVEEYVSQDRRTMRGFGRSALFVGELGHGSTTATRAQVLNDRGWRLTPVDPGQILKRSNVVERKLATKLQAGPVIERCETALLAALHESNAALAFFDKPIFVRPELIEKLRAMGVYTACYTPDDPFGPRRDGLWRLLIKAIPHYDLQIVPREVSLADFAAAGAREIVRQPFSYNPYLHRPPQPEERPQKTGYWYIGSPYDDRAEVLVRLREELARAGVPLSVRGDRWLRGKIAPYGRALDVQPGVYGEAYRNAIWAANACLAFVTRSNRDDLSRKAIEIAACGCAPVLEPVGLHAEIFVDGVSAVFFTSFEECVEKLKYYWTHPQELERIGAAAAAAVRASGLSEEAMIDKLEQAYTAKRGGDDVPNWAGPPAPRTRVAP